MTLNTGRIRDQWHTMTRTGKSQRLSAHMAEPFAEIHPADAALHGIKPADIVRVESEHAAILVRALITERQRKGAVFVPMHWTDQFAANARVGTLVPALTDPHSGQPALKNAAARIARFDAATYGFAVSAEKPDRLDTAYWAMARANGGWRLELAGDMPLEEPVAFARDILGLALRTDIAPLAYLDRKHGDARIAFFDGARLLGALWLSRDPVAVSRTWACAQLTAEHSEPRSRYRVLAGRADAGMPDKGAIVCSCFSVGANEIAAAIEGGCMTVAAVGEALSAGTNCGSCRAEIRQIINEKQPIAAE
jgi:assimilatory nitrate reductase catalytic subunit